jgi:hypothetical protein
MKMSAIETRFWRFHGRNPHVYELFNRFAMDLVDRGYKRLSANRIMERIRWETMVETTDPRFKINNNHRPYYARMWMKKNPDMGVKFETRRVTGDTL